MKTQAIRDATHEIDKWQNALLRWQDEKLKIRVSLFDPEGRYEFVPLSAKTMGVEESLRQNAVGCCLVQLAAAKAKLRAALETP